MAGPMEPSDVQYFESPADFRRWLEAHSGGGGPLWVGFWKKATGRPSLSWEESVDEALCFGWIDGIRKRISEEAYTIRFTPRRKGSVWSRRNLGRYSVLVAEGRVEPSGAKAFAERVEERTGVYSFEQETPHELDAEYRRRIQGDKVAWASWQKRPPGYRKRVTHWVMSAKRDSTRERRLSKLMEELTGRAVGDRPSDATD